MKKKVLMSAALMITLATLTGCGSKKTLTCTQKTSDNGFTNDDKVVYKERQKPETFHKVQ